MAAKTLQQYIQEERPQKQRLASIEAHHRMPDGKLIANVQICLYCERVYPFVHGRKYCPQCFGLLRVKTTVVRMH